jgi:hypothetical protein
VPKVVLKPQNSISQEAEMDFIERWFGFSPDGGDGSTELIYIVAAGVAIVLIFAFMQLKRRQH